MNKTNNEEADLRLLGQALKLIWVSNPVKILVSLLLIILIGCFSFSFRINPITTFWVFTGIIFAVIIFVFVMLLLKPELFQDSKTWFNYQQMLIGNDKTGLQILENQEKTFQPIITQTKTMKIKAKIIKPKSINE